MQLEAMSLGELERVYREHPPVDLPRGVWRGEHLGFLDAPGKLMRAIDTLLFVWPGFGIDFDRSLWWFLWPRLRVGRFVAARGPSRWREADVVRLEYDVSRLPHLVRGMLYDELKPLDETTVLGLGGVDAGPGKGDHFFFALRPLPLRGAP